MSDTTKNFILRKIYQFWCNRILLMVLTRMESLLLQIEYTFTRISLEFNGASHIFLTFFKLFHCTTDECCSHCMSLWPIVTSNAHKFVINFTILYAHSYFDWYHLKILHKCVQCWLVDQPMCQYMLCDCVSESISCTWTLSTECTSSIEMTIKWIFLVGTSTHGVIEWRDVKNLISPLMCMYNIKAIGIDPFACRLQIFRIFFVKKWPKCAEMQNTFCDMWMANTNSYNI